MSAGNDIIWTSFIPGLSQIEQMDFEWSHPEPVEGTAAEGAAAAAGWHPDPIVAGQLRYWDGSRWTEKIRDGGTRGIDPPGIDEAPQAPGEAQPARPIEDAPLPLRPPAAATQVALVVGTFVLVALVVVILVVALAG